MDTLERIRCQFERLPAEKQQEVADFVAYLNDRYGEGEKVAKETIHVDLKAHRGRLRDSPHLNEHPLSIQRGLRNEW